VLNAASTVAGVDWPPIPSPAASLMLAMQHQLEHTQWLSSDALRERQQRQLLALLAYCHASFPFYRARFERAGLHPHAALDEAAFARLPLLTRREVQDAGAALRAPALPPAHGQPHAGHTSGSTAEPLTFWASDLAYFFEQAFTLRDHLWHARDLSAKLMVFRVSERTGTLPGWFIGPDGTSLIETGPCIVAPLTLEIAGQARVVLEQQPAYLQGHASQLVELARHWLERRLPAAGVREVRSFAEALSPEGRALIRRAFDAKVTDVYSAQECGCLALQCPIGEHYHLQSEGARVEILREDGQPCAPGETGRVVVTPLHNFAMPLIRYDIGDFAEAGEPCACGRGLPVATRILGRVRNMLTLESGGKVWPLIGYRYHELAPVRRFQVVQTAPGEVELHLVVDRALTRDEEQRVRAHLLERLGHPFRVRLVYREALARSSGGKFEDFISMLG
jgi:phenylacetate-CoA ligase